MSKKEKIENEEGEMNLTGHLRELRNRIIHVILIFFVAVIAIFNYSQEIVDYFIQIGVNYGYNFVYLSPSELFMQYIRVTIIAAIVLIVPVIFFEIWAFIKPGLRKNENTIVFLAMMMGLGFFVLGVLFAHKIIMPFMLQFYMKINVSDIIEASISVENYVGFIMSNFLIFGCVFEMPVVVTLLTQLGLINYRILQKARRIAIVLIFILAAIITPPDVVSQCLCAGPMILLFEVSVQFSKMISKRKAKKAQENE